jgi:hypothetical protein
VSGLLGALKDPEFFRGLLENTRQMGGGLLSGTLGAPVDLMTMLMRPAGYATPDKKVMGSSEHIGGLLGLNTDSLQYKVGSLLPTDPGDALRYGGLLAGVGPSTWFKGMYPHDWTKEVKRGREVVDPGPLIDPSQIQRTTPFQTFGGERPEIDGVRGFFAKDPAVASRFADVHKGAVYPVEISGKRAITIDAKGKPARDIQFGRSGKKFQDAASSGKYDVIYIKNTADEGDIAVALHGSDIRSSLE